MYVRKRRPILRVKARARRIDIRFLQPAETGICNFEKRRAVKCERWRTVDFVFSWAIGLEIDCGKSRIVASMKSAESRNRCDASINDWITPEAWLDEKCLDFASLHVRLTHKTTQTNIAHKLKI